MQDVMRMARHLKISLLTLLRISYSIIYVSAARADDIF
ncbi:hypothetical protein YE105_C2218 [Yersinia enterocolitica subsp. palearctica 105.5R(r)]|nr:hypothetical protein YE105_C2218 [Yersinia enterocolitica subsp. palearctica 105.5R(r)]CCO68709.1 hypothetical protein D322_1835 [Yersinia enterocolitica IP 10393]